MAPSAHYLCISTHNIAVVSSKGKLLWPPYTSIQAINFLLLLLLLLLFISVFQPYDICCKYFIKVWINWIELNRWVGSNPGKANIIILSSSNKLKNKSKKSKWSRDTIAMFIELLCLYWITMITELHLQGNENWTSRPRGKITLNNEWYLLWLTVT